MVGPNNVVPACVTPGRLTAYLKSRNPKLDARYDKVTTEYMRQGEMLGLRWDFAFYQMIVETGALSYWRGSRAGDVKPTQNNFAGLGATGKGERGESFADIETGVRAHLEHLLLYAGKSVENPVAQRTRNVRDWNVLTAWHQTFTRPITFADMSTRWAQSKTYASMLKLVAERFHAEVCNGPDPQPGLVQEARQNSVKTAAAVVATTPAVAAAKAPEVEQRRPSGQELAQQAIEQAKAEGNDRRSALGAQPPPPANSQPAPFKVLNVAPPPEAPAQNIEPPAAKAPPATKASVTETKAAPAPNTQAKAAPAEQAKAAPAEKGPTKTALAAPAAKAKAIIEIGYPSCRKPAVPGVDGQLRRPEGHDHPVGG